MTIKTLTFTGILLTAFHLQSCQVKQNKHTEDTTVIKDSLVLENDSLLTKIQKQTFQYFWEGAEPITGLARERIHIDGEYPQNDRNVVTIGGSGFGLMSLLVGIERGFISKSEGEERLHRILDYLTRIPRFQGAWAHWYHGNVGEVKAFSEKDNGGDIVETAFLAQGLLVVREYFKNGTEIQKEIANKADNLWRGINWKHYTNGQNVLFWHWSPVYEFGMNHAIQGYDECLISYVLAASSPTHAIDSAVYYQGWARNGTIKTDIKKFDIPTIVKHNAKEGEVGPLFWAHYSFLGLDPNGLEDKYVSYGDAVVNHAKINIAYADANPKQFIGYGHDKAWGWTASYSVTGYDAHHPDNDKSVVSPTAALASMPYTPKESIAFANYLFNNLGDKVWGPYGFYDAFSETKNWYPKRYLAIDQGPIVVMIENYRTGLIWNLFMNAPEIRLGLKKLGFTSPHLK
ncbi:beta-glucosidase [Sphingobacterium sp. DK4209]|uniref:Beta-glucosidase n=1 Tax=Sphingobacterium zhuxiongii TaxID=2662364 RepID=A0A5Q0QBJ9_9SPHI|nr:MULTISPECIES: glucoamylase family protein [unclassified Sphingobacterium]MVZ66938.1 beta-glucosidase [Sphingobacterium sp. DK4209]QGA26644.1 beta-glucosidase [Sphingobacterium sp. dk4302]